MTNDISRQAIKAVNEYVERFDGNWTEVRRMIEEDLACVREWGTTGSKLYESTLRFAFNALRPEATEPLLPCTSTSETTSG